MNEDLMFFGRNSTGFPNSDRTPFADATPYPGLLPTVLKAPEGGTLPPPPTDTPPLIQVERPDELVLGRNPVLPPVNLGDTNGAANTDTLTMTMFDPPTEPRPVSSIYVSSKDFVSPTLPPPPPVIDDLTSLPLPPPPPVIDDLTSLPSVPPPPFIDELVATPPSDRSWAQGDIIGAPEYFDHLGQAVATGDFNNDGYMDLAAGVPGESVGALDDAGAVNIMYGTASGLSTANNQIWTQDSPGIGAGLGLGAEAGDSFGAALTAGDFNGDGYADLAIGAPNEDISGSNATNGGAVTILYGGASGLTATGSEIWTQDSLGVSTGAGAETGDYFGQALTAGDFNNDGYADLAVGAPGEDVVDITNAGAVNVIYGSASGLTAAYDQIWHQNSGQAQASPVLNVAAEAGDNFGASLTTGDFDGDGSDDLAIGSPGDSVGTTENAGAAVVVYGSASRLTANGHQVWHQNSAGIADSAEPYDLFSTSLVAGDYNNDGIDDLAIGVPGEGIGNLDDAGAVNVIYGSAANLSAAGNQVWSQNSMGIEDSAEFGDEFGASLASSDFDGDGIDDLAVGVPREEMAASAFDSGAVNIIRGSNASLTSVADRLISQNTLNAAGNPPEAHDRFAWSLAAGDFNGDGDSDLAVGVPNEDIDGITDVGEIDIFYNV